MSTTTPDFSQVGAGRLCGTPVLDFISDNGANFVKQTQTPLESQHGASQLNAGGPYGLPEVGRQARSDQQAIDAEGTAIARMLDAVRVCPNWGSAVRAVHYVLRRIEEDKNLGYGKCP